MQTGTFTKVALKGVGAIWIAKTGGEICRIEFGGSKPNFLSKLSGNIKWTEKKEPLRSVIQKFKRFAAGKRVRFTNSVELCSGTPFQKKVWKNMTMIPWGETKSYTSLAQAIGRPKSYRAVANACGANPVPIIIPCHRVIASDGTLGGFSSGIKLKKRLLALEGNFPVTA